MSKASDKRIYSVRNIAEYDKNGADGSGGTYEYEVFTEVPAQGEFRRGPFSLVAWDVDEIPVGAKRALILTVKNCLVRAPTSAKPTNAGFYHGISMPAEICALATTVLRRRILLSSVVRMDGMPYRIPQQRPRPHDAITTGELNLPSLEQWMDCVVALPEEFHQAFILACRMYQEALSLIDDKPDLAYLLLVSCIEVFVGKLKLRTKEVDLPAEVRDALSKCADTEAREVLLNHVLDLDRGIGRNFVSFIQQHVSQKFWDASPKIPPEKGRIEEHELPSLLKRIYDMRSLLVHEAEPFPPNVLEPPDGQSEIDRRTELVVGGKRWPQKFIIPYARFFERLVQHVLTTFLLKNAELVPQPAA